MTDSDTDSLPTLIIIDTHPVIRKALAALLKQSLAGTHLIESESIGALGKIEFDSNTIVFIVVVNSDFEEQGSDLIAEIKTKYPHSMVILYGEEIKSELIISYFKAGVNGYLSKDQEFSEMINCITMVRSGRRYVNAKHMEMLFEYLIDNHKSQKKQDLLTPRQNQVAQYLIQGLTTTAIAEQTGLHISTISTFKTGIFSKLGIDNILQLRQIFEEDEK